MCAWCEGFPGASGDVFPPVRDGRTDSVVRALRPGHAPAGGPPGAYGGLPEAYGGLPETYGGLPGAYGGAAGFPPGARSGGAGADPAGPVGPWVPAVSGDGPDRPGFGSRGTSGTSGGSGMSGTPPRGRFGRTGRGGGGTRPRGGDVARLPGPLLRYRAARRPQGVPRLPYPAAAATGTAGCSYAELDRRARAVAAVLGARLRPGSRVMLAYPQGPDLAGAFFGCLYAGMAAIPLALASPGATEPVARAVRRCAPDVVLTGSELWTPLAVDRTRTQVLEADGIRAAGEPVWRLAQSWKPVGVLPGAAAYCRYHDDGPAGGRLETAMSHSDLSDTMGELAQAVRLGTDEENVGWIAAVHGVEDAVWRVLLPVRVSD
jgi:hypothetical protein